MKITKTTSCIFCGHTVTGESVAAQSDSFKITSTTSRVLGALNGILSGNPFSAYKHASGQSEEGIFKGVEKICGGGLYRFHCPNCGQSFEKTIL